MLCSLLRRTHCVDERMVNNNALTFCTTYFLICICNFSAIVIWRNHHGRCPLTNRRIICWTSVPFKIRSCINMLSQRPLLSTTKALVFSFLQKSHFSDNKCPLSLSLFLLFLPIIFDPSPRRYIKDWLGFGLLDSKCAVKCFENTCYLHGLRCNN